MEEFVKKVSEMRHWQKEYFRTRGSVAYGESRRLEREVDRMLGDLQQMKIEF